MQKKNQGKQLQEYDQRSGHRWHLEREPDGMRLIRPAEVNYITGALR